MVILLYAENQLGYIGKDNKLMYHIPQDMRRFKDFTIGNIVIMGRKTWESLPDSVRPLPERSNVVVSRQKDYVAPGAIVINDVLEFIADVDEEDKNIFVIGGAEIIEECSYISDFAYVTVIHDKAIGDTKVKPLKDKGWISVNEEYYGGWGSCPSHTFKIMENISHI